MKKLRTRWTCLRCSCAIIHPVDRWLIIFMLILLAQSAFTLFTNGNASDTNSIDVIVRTSAAAIFGYFMSENFICHKTSGGKGSVSQREAAELADRGKLTTDTPQNRIGFVSSMDEAKLTSGGASASVNVQDSEELAEGRLQITVVAAAGLICLVALIIIRNVPAWNEAVLSNSSAAATVAQFRDFISGCVGFLIGCPTAGKSRSSATV